jgi:malonyl-CoA decarboxylase
MTPNTQTSSGLSNSKLAPVDRARQLAATLLSERGEASGAQVARELHHVLRALDADDRHSFQRYLATEFQPDKTALHTAAVSYLADTTAKAAAALAEAADPPRQELLRRMNMAPGGTGALIAMRSELTAHLPDEPELTLLDADLRHLFASWFNRGFLELRRIDWQSPAAVLEKLIAYEAAAPCARPPLLRILPSRASRRAADLRRSRAGAGVGHSHAAVARTGDG